MFTQSLFMNFSQKDIFKHKYSWIRPAPAAENYLVNQSVRNGPCIAIACKIDAANDYEKSIGLWGENGGYNNNFEGYVFHSEKGCGLLLITHLLYRMVK